MITVFSPDRTPNPTNLYVTNGCLIRKFKHPQVVAYFINRYGSYVDINNKYDYTHMDLTDFLTKNTDEKVLWPGLFVEIPPPRRERRNQSDGAIIHSVSVTDPPSRIYQEWESYNSQRTTSASVPSTHLTPVTPTPRVEVDLDSQIDRLRWLVDRLRTHSIPQE